MSSDALIDELKKNYAIRKRIESELLLVRARDGVIIMRLEAKFDHLEARRRISSGEKKGKKRLTVYDKIKAATGYAFTTQKAIKKWAQLVEIYPWLVHLGVEWSIIRYRFGIIERAIELSKNVETPASSAEVKSPEKTV